ncbi:hypothetical protein [Flavobacterium oreochromis]|uniref:hypothetical protein n=1 Tax=Flavobacterium oreochromis TaxID=2906078 RepID=UPI000B4D5F7A|nr:hypothetical protein [Flavobacterium oreochromis]OWP74055.1 hypothetical protein BWG23_15125 [Flavobacterium oreochromis]
MYYLLEKKIENVLSFESLYGNFIQNNKLNNLYDSEISLNNFHYINLYNFNRYIIATDDLNKGVIIEGKNIIFDFNEKFRLSSFNYPYLNYYKKTNPRVYGIFDFEKSKQLIEIEQFLGRDIFNKFIISNSTVNSMIFQNREITNKKILWNLDSSILGNYFKLGDGEVPVEIFKFLGILENHLIAVCTDSSLLKIDIETGKIIKRFHIELFKNSSNEHVAQYNYIKLINNRLIYFKNGCFVEYDLIEEKIIIEFDISENLKNENLIDNAPDFVLENNLLYYFISGFGSFSRPSLVILDINLQKITWSFIYENDNVTFREFKKNDRNLFALDSENVLHIFEKTSEEST